MALQKREKKLLKALGIIAVISGIVLFFVFREPSTPEAVESGSQEQSNQQSSPQTNTSSSRPRPTASSGSSSGGARPSSGQVGQAIVSIDEFQRHNSVDDCWVLIKGKVYDITEYLSSLPNKQVASPYCGTFAFEEGFLGETGIQIDSIVQNSIEVGTMG
jgi:cytoskeletal protein RodZ